MALVNFTNLDFDQVKSSIKEYLRANSNFTDYDFEGSNLSMIIDVLAYNTYISSYNANMVSNEVFIDSATLRENVVSLARNVGYIPRSKTSAKTEISFFVDTTNLPINPLTLTLQKGIVCTSLETFSGSSYTFLIPEDITVPVVNGVGTFTNIEIYEGTPLNANFTVDANNPNQRFILENPNIDTSLIRVTVRNTRASNYKNSYQLSNSLFDIDGKSRIFFIQEIEDENYELIFGDNMFGKKLENLNFIDVFYSTCNGEEANGISNFNYNGRIVDQLGRVITNDISLITASQSTYGGSSIETVSSIKKYAPRIYASQNRAVTSSDYEAIIPLIYPETESVTVFGGEELNPPRYGKVFITIKPYHGNFVPNSVKDNIKDTLKKYSVAGIITEILDLKYLFVEVDSTIYYNENLSQDSNFIKSIVSSNVVDYAKSAEMNKYGARFKYSKFLKLIDDSHDAITSNITKITLRRDLYVKLKQYADYEICYGNQFHIKNFSGYNIKSSGFNISGVTKTVYMTDIPNEDGVTGKIVLFTLDNKTTPVIVRKNAGVIDYSKGEIRLYPINITSTDKYQESLPIIQISAIPKSNDVLGYQDLYLQLDINNSMLNIVKDSISSGSDTSGSNYKVTSSYVNGELVRR